MTDVRTGTVASRSETVPGAEGRRAEKEQKNDERLLAQDCPRAREARVPVRDACVGLALLGRLFSCPTVHVLVTGNQSTALLPGLSPVAA